MPISHKYKLIFIHIPKCAGVSVWNTLGLSVCDEDLIKYDYPVLQHLLPNQLKQTHIDKNTWDSYRKFTIIRNPYDRVVSDYFWLKEHAPLIITNDFDDFLALREDVVWNNKYNEDIYYDHFYPMHFYFEGITYDHVIRFESLEDGFQELQSLYHFENDLLKYNVSHRDGFVLNKEQQIRIYNLYERDFHLFKYDKDINIKTSQPIGDYENFNLNSYILRLESQLMINKEKNLQMDALNNDAIKMKAEFLEIQKSFSNQKKINEEKNLRIHLLEIKESKLNTIIRNKVDDLNQLKVTADIEMSVVQNKNKNLLSLNETMQLEFEKLNTQMKELKGELRTSKIEKDKFQGVISELLEEVRNSQEIIEIEKIKNAETLTIINKQKLEINWYNRTYHERKLIGINKDRVKSKVKSKVDQIKFQINIPRFRLKLFTRKKMLKAKNESDISKKVVTIIVNYNCNDNAKKLRETYSTYFDTYVLDSGSDKKEKEFICFGNIYYSGLFNEAYKIAKQDGYEFMFFICSDVIVEKDQLDIISRNLNRLNLDTLGLYSPSSSGRSHSQCKQQETRKFRVVDFVEGFIFMANMTVLDKFAPLNLNSNKYGWGLDAVKGYFAKELDLLCIIDDEANVYHPGETGYSNEKAEIQMNDWFNTFPEKEGILQLFDNTRYGYNEEHMVSIIIPCYNQEAYIIETLFSIFCQYFSNYEIIIVNDGSTDKSKEVLQYYIDNFSQVKYIEQKNQGLSAARNTGLKNVTGSLIQFLDADDTLSKNKMVLQVKSFIEEDIEVSYSKYLCFEDASPEKTWTYSRVEMNSNPLLDLVSNWEKDLSIPIHCFMYKSNFIDKVRFNTNLPNHEDWQFHIEVALKGGKYNFSDKGEAKYRVRTDSMSRNVTKMIAGKRMCLQNILDLGVNKSLKKNIEDRLTEVKIVVGVFNKNNQLSDYIRNTWGKELLHYGSNYFLLKHDKNAKKNEIINDTFVGSFDKNSNGFIEFIEYVYNTSDFEYVFLLDDETYLNVVELFNMGIVKFDALFPDSITINNENILNNIGFGSLINRLCMKAILNESGKSQFRNHQYKEVNFDASSFDKNQIEAKIDKSNIIYSGLNTVKKYYTFYSLFKKHIK